MNACASCGDLAPLEDAILETKLNLVSKSAKQGCESCALLRHAINDCIPEVIVDRKKKTVSVVIRRSILRNFIEVAVRSEERTVVLDLFVTANTYCPWRDIRIGVETSGNTVSLASFQLVQKWLTQCVQDHESCMSSTRTALPSRVLDCMSIEPNVRLCEPHDKNARYISLSHCWGDSRGVITTKANFESFKKTIDFASLPRTFQEAIIFTRKLGIQYLWIDSLCILQDDEQDWHSESGKMAHIYKNSHLTLAATGSKSDNGGLFAKHPKTKIRGVFRDGTDYEIHARPVINHFDQAQFPLFGRAWVYQERLLSRRVLHFGRQELWWECLECVDCECSGIFHGDRYSTGENKVLTKIAHKRALANSALPQVSRRWHEIVEEFSQLALTKPTDKLPALAGIAEQIQELRVGTYLGGLWSDTIISDLLWYRLDPSTATRPDTYISPSWSWAALGGAVKYFDGAQVIESPNVTRELSSTQSLKGMFLDVIQATTMHISENRFGAISSAHMSLMAFIVPVQVFDARTLSAGRSLGRQLFRTRSRSAHYEFRFEGEDGLISYHFSADYDLRSHDLTFNTANYAITSVAQDDDGDDYALILKCIEKSQNIYERIGLFTTKFHRWRTSVHLEIYNASFKKLEKPERITLV